MGENESKKKKYIFLDNTAFRIPNWIKQAERRKTMKYIRTKESVNPVVRQEDIELFEKTGQKLADTIEELCDVLVVFYPIINVWKICPDTKWKPKRFERKYIYGAIWTDKGLIYVAKMNNKGELELL